MTDCRPVPDVSPALRLLAMLMGNLETPVIRVAAELGLANLLKDRSRSLADLAEATGSDGSASGRVLGARVDPGLVG